MNKMLNIVLAAAVIVTASEAYAARRMNRADRNAALVDVCPENKRAEIGSTFFYKNNKPIRASSAINAPVIGQNPVMTLAGQPGKGKGLFKGSGKLFASDGTLITSMAPFPCRADHCGGRVVSSMKTATARRKAVKATGSPVGFVKIGGGLCVRIPDIGGCFGAHVNKSRPLCDRIVK